MNHLYYILLYRFYMHTVKSDTIEVVYHVVKKYVQTCDFSHCGKAPLEELPRRCRSRLRSLTPWHHPVGAVDVHAYCRRTWGPLVTWVSININSQQRCWSQSRFYTHDVTWWCLWPRVKHWTSRPTQRETEHVRSLVPDDDSSDGLELVELGISTTPRVLKGYKNLWKLGTVVLSHPLPRPPRQFYGETLVIFLCISRTIRGRSSTWGAEDPWPLAWLRALEMFRKFSPQTLHGSETRSRCRVS